MSLLLLLRSGNQFTQIITNDAGVTDSASAAAGRALAVTDTLAGTDSSTFFSAHGITVVDDAGLRDSLGLGPVTDTLGMTDNVSFQVSFSVPDDTLGMTDSAAGAAGRTFSTADTLGLADDTSSVTAHLLSFSDALGLSDSSSTAAVFAGPIFTDDAGLTDPFTAPRLLFFSVTDDAGLTDSSTPVRNAFLSFTVNDDAGSSDSSLSAAARTLTVLDLLAGTDNVLPSVARTLSVTDLAALTDTLGAVNTPPSNYTFSVTDTLGGSDSNSSAGQFFTSFTDSSGLTDVTTTVYQHTALQLVQDGFGLSDSIGIARGISFTITDNVGLDSGTTRSATRGQAGRVIQMVEYITRMED